MPKKKILIVEDDASLLQVLSDRLEQEGFRVHVATNGLDGLISALENKPALILLDIMMPDLDGMQMLKKLRGTKHGKEIPVVLLTALNNSGTMHESIQFGAQDYMLKSDWKLEDVVASIKLYC